jgi:hypothetical protein
VRTDQSSALRFAILAALAAGAAPAAAFEFQWGEVEGNFDTTVSAGIAARVEDPDRGSIGIANGGTARTINEDDGNLNYDAWDIYSAALKATHELELERGDFGGVARVSYFYDFAAAGDDFLGAGAEDRLVSEATLYDLYLYGTFHLGERPLRLRLGNQVVNWGESTFIGNGINVINPIDVARLRVPGSEIKEALLPSPIVYASLGFTDDLSMEAFWIQNYSNTRIDPRGSFFSTNDFISDGGDLAFAGFARRNDQHFPFVPPSATAPAAQVFLPRDPNRELDDDGDQYGVALRYFSEALNYTEFGLYYLNYDNRTPIVSAVRGASSNIASTTPRCSTQVVAGCRATYFAEFPEDIDLWGLSFNTNGPWGLAIQGEYSYRPNQPIQLASVELLLASLGLANNITGTATGAAAAVAPGTVIPGHHRVNMHQAQVTLTKAFGPTWGAEQFVLLGEFGYNYLNLPEGRLFNAPGTSLPAPGSANAAGGSFQPEGYADRSSWGYRVLARMDFENAIGPAQLSPRLAFFHDVSGVGPNFNEGAKAIAVGVSFNYLQNWQGDLSYTTFFGGRRYRGSDTVAPPPGQSRDWEINANPLRDRDFVSLSVSYSF